MTPLRSLAAALLVLLTTGLARADDVTLESLLERMTDLDRLTRPVRDGERHRLFSSTSPASGTAERGSAGWFANDDSGHVLSEFRTGTPEHVEYVLAEQDGPGAVVRIWSADPKGTLRVYVDGGPAPTIEAPMADLLGGKVAWCPPPLAGTRGGGSSLFLPLPFARSLKVTCTEKDLYYHVDVATFPGDTVQPVTRERLAAASPLIEKSARALARLANSPTPAVREGQESSQTFRLMGKASDGSAFLAGDPSQTALFTPRVAGPDGTVAFDLMLTEFACNDAKAALARVLVVMSFDGVERVRVPLGHFFACGPRGDDHRGIAAGLVKPVPGWRLYNRLPMPFRTVAEIRIENRSGFELAGRLSWRVRPARTGETLPLGAVYHEFMSQRTRPRSDLMLCDLERAGRVVGTVLSVSNPVPIWWGEGDEKLSFDGEAAPSWIGTGTEDYFGAAWGSGERFSHPFHGQPTSDGPKNQGTSTLVRWHVPDPIPFQDGLRFELELWHQESTVVSMASTVFFYGGRAKSPFPAGSVPAFPY